MAKNEYYDIFHDHFDKLTGAIIDNLPDVATKLKGKGLITGDNRRAAVNDHNDARTRASNLIQILEDKIRYDESSFKEVGEALTAALGSNKILDIFKQEEVVTDHTIQPKRQVSRSAVNEQLARGHARKPAENDIYEEIQRRLSTRH